MNIRKFKQGNWCVNLITRGAHGALYNDRFVVQAFSYNGAYKKAAQQAQAIHPDRLSSTPTFADRYRYLRAQEA